MLLFFKMKPRIRYRQLWEKNTHLHGNRVFFFFQSYSSVLEHACEVIVDFASVADEENYDPFFPKVNLVYYAVFPHS